MLPLELQKLEKTKEELRNLSEQERQKLEKIKRGDFLIILAQATFRWEKEENIVRKRVTIELPPLDSDEKKCIVAYDENGRKLLEGRHIDPEYSSFNIPWEREAKKFLLGKKDELQLLCRWAAGGAIPVLEFKNGDMYAVLIRRDKKAPIHPQHLTTASGLSEHWEELIDPRIIIGREFGEEVIIANKSGIIYKYKFKLPGNENKKVEDLVQKYYEEEYRDKIGSFENELEKCYGIKKEREEYVDAEIIPLGEDIIEINLSENKKEIEGACVLDPVFGAVDVIGAILVKLKDVELGEIQVLDFDTKRKKALNMNYEFLNRNIFLIKIKEGLKDLIEGKAFKCTVFHKQLECEKPLLTPPLRATLVSCYNRFSSHKTEYGYTHSGSKLVRGVEDES